MRRLFRSVAADRHAAPATRAAACVIRKEKRAGWAFAGFDPSEIRRTDHFTILSGPVYINPVRHFARKHQSIFAFPEDAGLVIDDDT